MMKLYVPVPGCLKFEKIFNENNYLQEILNPDDTMISIWHINSTADMGELRRILATYHIRYTIKK